MIVRFAAVEKTSAKLTCCCFMLWDVAHITTGTLRVCHILLCSWGCCFFRLKANGEDEGTLKQMMERRREEKVAFDSHLHDSHWQTESGIRADGAALPTCVLMCFCQRYREFHWKNRANPLIFFPSFCFQVKYKMCPWAKRKRRLGSRWPLNLTWKWFLKQQETGRTSSPDRSLHDCQVSESTAESHEHLLAKQQSFAKHNNPLKGAVWLETDLRLQTLAPPSAEVNSVHHFFSLLFCLDLSIHVDVSLTPGTHLSFVADQMHLYSLAYVCRAVDPRHLSEITQKTYQKALQIPPIPTGLRSYNLNWENPRGPSDWWQTPPEVLSPSDSGSELFQKHKDLHNISQVVLMLYIQVLCPCSSPWLFIQFSIKVRGVWLPLIGLMTFIRSAAVWLSSVW